MAKKPTKQATPKSTETNEIMVATVDLPKTPEQAMDELTELSQELGLYDVESNPLVKDESTMPIEASTEAVESVQEEMNPTVAQTEEIDSSIGLEPLNATEENEHLELIPTVEVDSPPVDDKLTLKDAWDRPIPTTLITLQTVNYTELVSQVLYLAYLGGELDRSYRIMTTVPYRIRLLLPTENYGKWISKEDVMGYDENVSYNKVLVRGFDLYSFWRNIIKIGKNGAIIVPRTVAQRVAGYMVSCYTRAPIADTPESRVSLSKIKYTKEELESFTLESLKIVASWYEGIPSMNAKKGYVKEILIKQGN